MKCKKLVCGCMVFMLIFGMCACGKKEKAKEDMQKMLDYVDKLDELDTSSVEPMSHIFEDENVFREDVVTNGDNHEAMLSNAPKQKENQYQVPKTIG